MSRNTARGFCLLVAAAVISGTASWGQPIPVFAVGDRVADGNVGGLQGIIVRIGGGGDPYYLRNCYAIHFDYEQREPDRVEWTCLNTGSKLFKLGAPANQAAGLPQAVAAQPGPQLALPAPAQPQQAPLPAAPPPAPANALAVAAPAASHYATPPDQSGQGNGAVQSGLYQCYGVSSPLGGFNFSITGPGGYSDIEGKAGTYSIGAGMLTFHGGAHDGQRATFFAGPDSRHPSHITFENALGGGLGISCDKA